MKATYPRLVLQNRSLLALLPSAALLLALAAAVFASGAFQRAAPRAHASGAPVMCLVSPRHGDSGAVWRLPEVNVTVSPVFGSLYTVTLTTDACTLQYLAGGGDPNLVTVQSAQVAEFVNALNQMLNANTSSTGVIPYNDPFAVATQLLLAGHAKDLLQADANCPPLLVAGGAQLISATTTSDDLSTALLAAPPYRAMFKAAGLPPVQAGQIPLGAVRCG